MDINELLRGVDCSCGRRHDCPIDAVFVERGAAGRLAEVFPDAKSILMVADENTFAAAGKGAEAALSGRKVEKMIFPGSRVLVPDEEAVAAVEAALGDATALVGVGSGVIQDLCKYVSFDKKIPYAVVATAPSMDGYASNGAAMILGGMKVTVAAGLPRAILADPAVLKDAPMDMIRAGYGDIIGKFSALNDWKLSRCVNGEYFCRWIWDVTMDQVKRTMALADGLLRRDETAVATLMEALVVVGV
ncbi:MAG: iron-containing alcohol dehydrogenase, partial [Clostridia bacterium]|nr:iron-containing alcohol dehydrogenase [Clostridia bacterium]